MLRPSRRLSSWAWTVPVCVLCAGGCEREEAAHQADARRGDGAPTWAEDEQINHRIFIEGGELLMGSPEGVGYEDERPLHRVRLSPFYLQEHEVTNEEYRRFKPDHEFPQGEEKHPAAEVSWEDADAYAKWLGGRLPTEAEWEYACRAGTTSRWSFGDDESELERYAWITSNSWYRAHPVGKLAPNDWGLFDMHGNVWEWVADWYGPYPDGPQRDPLNEDSASGWRVFRGGSFLLPAVLARSADRSAYEPDCRFCRGDSLGFRVAFDAAPSDDE